MVFVFSVLLKREKKTKRQKGRQKKKWKVEQRQVKQKMLLKKWGK